MEGPVLKQGMTEDGLPIKVYAGLHYLKGNTAPYFSLTADVFNPKRRGADKIDRCGCLHDEILKLFPEFAPLVALQLSDIDGVPMHAVKNAIYWAAGVLGGDKPLGQQYHGSNGDFDSNACLKILEKHLRIDEQEAKRLVGALNHAYKLHGLSGDVRGYMVGYVKGCKPKWKAEADSAIQEFNLVVYGDPWTRSVA
jgi:hypothetical protein